LKYFHILKNHMVNSGNENLRLSVLFFIIVMDTGSLKRSCARALARRWICVEVSFPSIFRSDYSKRKFDLFVSNLVFHNFGRKRFNAYERLAQWTTPKSYIMLGDLFFDYKRDSKLLTALR